MLQKLSLRLGLKDSGIEFWLRLCVTKNQLWLSYVKYHIYKMVMLTIYLSRLRKVLKCVVQKFIFSKNISGDNDEYMQQNDAHVYPQLI